MKSIEFYNTPEGEVMIKPTGEPERLLQKSDEAFIHKFLSVIREFYSAAYNALMDNYNAIEDKKYKDFISVRRFIKCNLGAYDNMIDLDEEWNFQFEFVGCPLRGECKFDQIICSPKFDTKLSERQLEVMELICEGFTDSQVADRLFISLNTVNNHRKNSLKKLGMHSTKEFVLYANKYKIFK